MQARVASLEEKVAQLSQRVSDLEIDLSNAQNVASTRAMTGILSLQQSDPDASEQVNIGYRLAR